MCFLFGWFARVDLCHQSNDEDDEDDGYNPREALLEKMNKENAAVHSGRKCCSFRAVHVGSHQKIVILVHWGKIFFYACIIYFLSFISCIIINASCFCVFMLLIHLKHCSSGHCANFCTNGCICCPNMDWEGQKFFKFIRGCSGMDVHMPFSLLLFLLLVIAWFDWEL